jgi:hypothetical protein
MTVTANGAQLIRNNVTAITAAGSQYIMSAKFKGVVGRKYRLVAADNGPQTVNGTEVTADGTWQTATVTVTYGGSSTVRYAYLGAFTDALIGDIVYWDAIQLEAGAVQTPFALDSRTECMMTIPNATIGLTAGMDLTIMIVLNCPWAGDDGAKHWLFAAGGASPNRINIYKENTNRLYVEMNTAASSAEGSITAVNWPANTDHIIVVTRSGANVNGYLNGLQILSSTTNTMEGSVGTNACIGTTRLGGNCVDGAILAAVWGRALV